MGDRLDCGRCGESLREQRYAENDGKGAIWVDGEEVECAKCHALNRIEFEDNSEDAALLVVETTIPTVH